MLNPQRWGGNGVPGVGSAPEMDSPAENGYESFGKDGTLFEVCEDEDEDAHAEGDREGSDRVGVEDEAGSGDLAESRARENEVSDIDLSKRTNSTSGVVSTKMTSTKDVQGSMVKASRASTMPSSGPCTSTSGEALDLLLSLGVSLQFIHTARDPIKRLETFAVYPGATGTRVRETLDEAFCELLSALGARHISWGFGIVTERMSSYKPAEHQDTTSVSPLLQFFELVHIGDTIQSWWRYSLTKQWLPILTGLDDGHILVKTRIPETSIEDLDAAFTRSVSRDSSSTGAPTPSPSTPNSNDANDGSTLSLSGLLNSLDGVAAAEGRLLFATTNHIERLDPALSRPGRMDVWVNFTHATKWQAEGIFKCFFPSKPVASPSSTSQEKIDVSQKNLPLPKRGPGHAIPVLEEAEIAELAKRFADAIPEGELSVAALQGYLLKNKVRPRECVDEVGDWIIQERETREKLKKEKAEREAKEKKELAEERERRGNCPSHMPVPVFVDNAPQKEEKAAKEQNERETREKLEKRNRAKSKKAHRAETVMKLEGATAAPASSTPADAVIPVVHSESVSSSESDTSNGGIEADTEESMTSEEEPDKPAGATSDAKEQQQTTAKDKWIAVKGHQPPPPPPSSSSSSPLDS
ncbi:hypothetical protein JVU11DRAFT_10854 [Chiua virens]|nr:hypothetical protein JVU11DRAFT_10854 [Chiua virens]